MTNEIKKEWVIMANEIRTEHAIQTLKPNAKFLLRGDVLEWLDSEQTEPTTSELSTEVKRLQGIYDNNAYQRKRLEEYPSMADQLDDIYHNGVDEWKNTIKVVKDKYPKPS
jgi:hypothetical protein